MFYDTATLEIIVRSVALSAFVETPRDAVIIAQRSAGRSRLAAAKTARDSLSGSLRALRRGLPLAGKRLSRLVEAGRPSDRPSDPFPA
ncbi:MAG: hypothetical protein ACFCUQ_16680 [Kiloniellales bacterium]